MRPTLVLISVLSIVLYSCKSKADNITREGKDILSITCSIETLSEDGEYIMADNDSIAFNRSCYRTDSIARSGKYSLVLSKKNPFGFTIDMDNIQKNEKIYAEFWCFGKVPFLVFTDNTENYYKAIKEVADSNSAGWKKVSYRILTPGNLKNSTLRVYVWNPSDTAVFVDDFSLRQVSPVVRDIAPDMLLKIVIDSTSWKKIETKRIEALAKGILESGDNDYVKVRLIYEGDTLKGGMRLKGDWLDHLQGDKWSYRIKLKSKYSWKGMKTFSLQTPESRSFIDEWLAHELYHKEDVLTTRYGFINLEVNGVDMGVYAYEEHFDKYLIEYNNRREGPILKFAEERFWLQMKLFNKDGIYYNIPTYEECEILPFKPNRTANSENLLNQFENAQNLMMMYRSWEYPSHILFDIDKLARYSALINVTNGYHGIAWHNQRFYFNPVLCTLEPIAFDCYTTRGVSEKVCQPIYYDFDDSNDLVKIKYTLFNQYYLDYKFRELYLFYLQKYSDEKYINSFYNEYIEYIRYYENLMKEEFFYEYDFAALFDHIQQIREDLKVKMDKLKQFTPPKVTIQNSEKNSFDLVQSPEIPSYYVSAYCQKEEDQYKIVKVVNDYSADIRVIGYTDNSDFITFIREKSRIGSINTGDNKKDIKLPKNTKSVIYTTDLYADTFYVKLYKWKYPESASPRVELLSNTQNAFITKYTNGKKIVIPKGNYTFTSPLIIPEGYQLEVMAGAKLNFIQKSFLLSYSPISLIGNPGEQIVIWSSDSSSMGFIVMQAKGKSTLRYVSFHQLDALDYKGWTITGAVTFYESEVDLSNVYLTDNMSEDCLNIIRSNFVMKNCFFNNINSDAFDSDFSEGTIDMSFFRNIGNDAIDFSGSEIQVSKCRIENIADKGISCGEKSNMIITDVHIYNANIALASKDNSLAEISNSTFNSSKYGFAVFNKKSEFHGKATIKSSKVILNQVEIPMLVEQGSVVIENGKTIEGTEIDVADFLYPKEK